jgi:hypothetical protein
MRRLATALAVISLNAAAAAHAQRPSLVQAGPAFAHWSADAAAPTIAALHASIVAETQRTHWVRGGLIGAGIGAVAFGVLGAVVCSAGDEPDCAGAAVGTAVLGAGVGFLTGALVGGAFRKDEPTATAP